MKRIYLVFFCISAAAISLYADIRECVCIVRPQYNEKTLQFMENAAKEFSKAGYSDIAELFENAQKGVFGSGFFIRSNGKIYVLTNHHVAAYSSFLTLEIEDIEGKSTKLENCPLIAYDEELDLAIAEVPYTTVKSVLTLSDKNPQDGADVWSAGYPGLGGKPLWQFGKGTVTNAAVRLPSMIDPQKSVLLQHSAPIDSGNSGGPLLVKSQAAPEGYEVAGINTAQAFFRQSTNFAIPASTIKNFITSKALISKEKMLKNLTDELNEFVKLWEYTTIEDKEEQQKDIIKHLRKLSFFISEDYAIENGIEAYIAVLRKASSTVRKEILAASILGNPINGIRTAVAYQMYSEIMQGKKSYKAESALKAEDLPYEAPHYRFTMIDEDGSKMYTLWKNVFNSWEIDTYSLNELPDINNKTASASGNSKKKAKKAKHTAAVSIADLHHLFRMQFSYLGLHNTDKKWRSGFAGGLFYTATYTYVEFGLSYIMQQQAPLSQKSDRPFSRGDSLKFCVGLLPELRLQIPLNMNDTVILIPQLAAGAGVFLPPLSTMIQYSAGLDVLPAAFDAVSVGADFTGRVWLRAKDKHSFGIKLSFSMRF